MTVYKHRITTPERQLGAVAATAERLAHRWNAISATHAAMNPPLLRAASTVPGGRTSDHADPTTNYLMARSDWDDILEAIEAWTTQGKWIEEKVRRYERETTDAGDLKDRCRNHPDRSAAVADRPGNKLGGLCTACIKQRQRTECPTP